MLKKFFIFFIFILILTSSCKTSNEENNEEKEDPAMKAFTTCIYESGVRIYGSFTCSTCARQRKLLGTSFHNLKEIECHPHGENSQSELCLEVGIEHTPTWIRYEGDKEINREVGYQNIKELSEFSGCSYASEETDSSPTSKQLITGHAVSEPEYVDIRVSKAKCDTKGKLSLVLKNVQDKPADTSQMEVIVQSHKDPLYKTVVPGKWRFPVIKKWDPKLDTKQKKKSTFSSSAGVLNKSGNYDVIINYKGCRTDPGCSTKHQLINCPGNTYTCNKCTLQITKCEIKEHSTELTFTGLNADQYDRESVDEDLLFSFFGEKKVITRSLLPENLDYRTMQNDVYTISIPKSEYGEVSTVEVSHPYCDSRSFLNCKPPGEESEVIEEGVCVDASSDNSLHELKKPGVEQPLKWEVLPGNSSKKVTIIVIEEPSEAKVFTDKLVALLSSVLSSSG